jgi:hypothetical protein
MAPDDIATILRRLYACGPLLYIGLLLAIDPSSVAKAGALVSTELQQFKHHLRGSFHWRHRWIYEPYPIRNSPADERILRLAGIILTTFAFGVLAFAK